MWPSKQPHLSEVRVENYFGKITPEYTRPRFEPRSRTVIGGLVYCESNTLDHAATEADLHPSHRPQPLKLGHGGTLDHTATGVLGVCWGCKVLPKLLSGDKKYFVRGRFGTATDTYNEAGTTTKEATFDHITEEMVTATLKTFVGHVLQTPPKYSALKRDGIRLAELTRQGVDIIVRPRYVDCYSISCLQFSPPDFSLEVSCGGGYYIRSLVHDLGEPEPVPHYLGLGSCAHVTQLHRLQHGPFTE
uniref:tRNA pseudouridine(55) synthase n=1 Tax=Timema genevievae TaxID=629358 RepID=A0A7R9PQY4_TIMGE|nr:unnamed protein product [Timema genevievae]